MSGQDTWVWMPHPAHFICGFDCRFHLATKVGEVIVSTVGEYWPDEGTREILAKSRGIKLKGVGDERRASYMEQIGFEKIGCDRKYETMVFRATKGDTCCPWRCDVSGGELDMRGYNDPAAAYEGHLRLCREWDGRPIPEKQEERVCARNQRL